MEYVKSKHEIGLLRQDGTTSVGLMLARNKGNPQYKRYDSPSLSEQRAQGEPGYGWFPPEEELPIILDDFSGGLSREIYSSSDPTKYFKAINMDCRFGQPIAGLKSGTLTKPTSTNPTITNSDMELTTGWTATGAFARTNTQAHGGTYSWGDANGAEVGIYQDLSTTQIQGRRFTFTCWAYAPTGRAQLTIDDGVGTTVSRANITNNTWEQLTVTRTLDTAATQLRIKGDITAGANVAVYFDDAAVTRATVGVTTCHATYGGNEYINFGGLLAKISSVDGTISGAYEFPSPITALEVAQDGVLYVALESSGATIEDCEDAWNEYVEANCACVLDTADYKVGSGSVKITIGATAGVELIATEVVSNLNLSGYDGVKLWIKSSVATASGDFQLMLDNSVNCGSPLETLNIPALSANAWTKVYLDLAAESSDTNIISVGLYQAVDKGACTVWLDDINGEHRYYSIGVSGNPTKAGAGDVGADGYAKFLEMNGATMWKSLPPNRVYSCTDPADSTTWATHTTVDSSENDITALVSMANTLYISKEDRPFYLTAAGVVTVLADDTKSIQTSDSGEQSITWHGELFMPYGTASLLRYDGTVTTWIDPALYCINLGDFDGQVQGLAGDDEWLYAIVYGTTTIEVLAGQATASGWKWHGSLCEITLTGCETAFVSSVYKKRLYITSTAAGESLYYVNLYANYGDVTNDANRNFPDAGELYTPQLHGGFKGDTKAFIKVSAQLGHAYSATVYFECHYQIQGDTTWTDAGDFVGTATNRKATLFIPADSSGNKPKAEWIKFKLINKTGSATSTPILVNLDVRAILYVTKRRIIECVVRGCEKPTNKQGEQDAITASMIKTVLIEADNATWPVTFYPWGWLASGDTVYVNFLSCQEIVELDEESRNPESHWYLKLLEVALA